MDGAELGKEPPGLLGLTPGSVSCKGSGCTHRLPEPKNPALWRPKSLTMRVSELITPSGTTCASLGDALLSPHCPACIPDLLPLSHWPYWWSWSQSRAWGNISALPPGTLVGVGEDGPLDFQLRIRHQNLGSSHCPQPRPPSGNELRLPS